MDYATYVKAFNGEDLAALINTYYCDDVVFQGGSQIVRGADEFLQFRKRAREGVREVVRAQVVIRDESHIFAEVDTEFLATSDRPDFAFGALKKGDTTTVKFLTLYCLRNGRIAQIKAAAWPPNAGMIPPVRRLGGSPEERKAFLEYSRAFSGADFDTFSQYYTEDVTVQLASMLLNGRDAVVGFYRNMFQNVRESLTLNRLVADENGLCADIVTQFTAVADAPEFSVAPLKKGEFVRGRVFVYYTLRDGKICEIRVARAGPMSAPAPLPRT